MKIQIFLGLSNTSFKTKITHAHVEQFLLKKTKGKTED